MRVSKSRLTLTRRWLVKPALQSDFDWLAQQAILSGQPIVRLLQHLKLASYNRGLVNWQYDDKTYRDFVLSPIIGGKADEQLNWRRPLWESFYPRIRHESDPSIRCANCRSFPPRKSHYRSRRMFSYVGIKAIWEQELSDEAGFEKIYVAALRSVGIAARLNGHSQVELFSDGRWQSAPHPLFSTFAPD